jgi:hypothetical protein
MALASAALGALLTALSNAIAGRDLAGRLAAGLGLGSGPIFGSLVGALVSAWLLFGGRKRIAGFIGFACTLGAAVALWNLAQEKMWIVDAVLEGAFGPGSDEFSSLAVVVLLFVLGRPIADIVAGTTRSLLERIAGRAIGANP